MSNVIQIKPPVEIGRIVIEQAKADAVALALLMNAVKQIQIIADAFGETGRSEAATRMYEGVCKVCDGHNIIAEELKKRITQ